MKKNDGQRVIESIKKDFVHFIKSNSLLQDYISVFVVGSFVGTVYKIRKENDLDLRVILKKVTFEKAQLLDVFLQKCNKKYSSTDISISSSTVIGIAKPKIIKKTNILIHLIYFDMAEFQHLPAIHSNTYIKFHQHLAGTEIWKLKSVNLTIKNILEDPEGLFACKEMLKSNKLKYFEWTRFPDGQYQTVLKERFIEQNELIDCIKYAIFKPLINLLNLYKIETNDVEKTIQIIFHNKRYTLVKNRNVLLEYSRLQTTRTQLIKMQQFKNDVIEFLDSLTEFIKKFEVNSAMFEIEVVYKIKDVNKIRQTLLNTNHLLIKKEREVTLFLLNKQSDKVIRLKISPGNTLLSLKGGSFGEAREEVECNVDDYRASFTIFQLIGFEVDTYFFRTREHFTNKEQNITITLDETKGSIPLVEVEKITDEKKNVDAIRQQLKEFSGKVLNLKEEVSKEEFKAMLKKYNESQKNKPIDFNEIAQFINTTD